MLAARMSLGRKIRGTLRRGSVSRTICWGTVAEAELLIPYGPIRFASQTGQLAGNHFTDKRSPVARVT